MVLSLPVLNSFSKSSPASNATATTTSTSTSSSKFDAGNNKHNRPHHTILPPSASTDRSAEKRRSGWKPTTTATRETSSYGKSTSTLVEALLGNTFGATATATGTGTTSGPRALDSLSRQANEQRHEYDELNNALEKLMGIFPDVKIEVFRELLVRFDGESRLQICVEQLLRHKEEWVAGRWNVPDEQDEGVVWVIPPEERFRTRKYKASVRNMLCREFSSLSKSTVDAVLAEANFSYIRARPTLFDLSRRTWRATLHSILPFKRRKNKEDEHPLLVWQPQADGQLIPRVKDTGCRELDQELHGFLVAPLLMQRKEEQEGRDFQLAEELNENEAKGADALYECECCFGDITFEQISTCSTGSHIICYHCIRRTVHEALFGQGWSKSVDAGRATLKCIAPLSDGACDGSLQPDIVKRAIVLDKAGDETYRKFEDRLASDTLMKSRLKLVRCPFCSYAEVDSVYHPSPQGVCWHLRRNSVIYMTVSIVLLLDLIPLFVVPLIILLVLDAPSISAILRVSLRNICLKMRGKRFTCANPSCKRVSCMICQKQWRDPHVCHEPLLLDLRTTVEAARTAAVKRTCPRCGLSFVKSSGCNKLTCICGYSMCYLCRKGLGPPLVRGVADRPYDDDDDEETPEGYKHFCEHFRINPGSRCTECNKCDLYQSVDEEAVARGAGEKAEREWRIRQGAMTGNLQGLGQVNSDMSVTLSNGNSSSLSSITNSRLRSNNNNNNKNTNNRNNCNRNNHNRNNIYNNNNDIIFRLAQMIWSFSATIFVGCLRFGKNWRYWFRDVWKDGKWKLEGQALVDWMVEQVIIIDDL